MTMTLSDAIAIARSTRREIHDLGYANADDAIERAASVLADEVEAYQHMAYDECRWGRVYDDVRHCCRMPGRRVPCRLLGNGCKGYDVRVAE